MDILKQAQTQPIFSVYPNKISKKFTRYNDFLKEPDIINDDQIEIISLNNEDENCATNTITMPSNMQSSKTKAFFLSPYTNISSSNINILSPNTNILSPNTNPLSPNINPLSPNINPLSPNPDTSSSKQKKIINLDDSDDDNKLWPNSAIKSLLSYLSDNMSSYRMNKDKFYLKAAIYLGKGKTGKQVHNKMQSLISKYMNESSNKTGKGASTWLFYTEMNNIFGNRENVNPDFIINSMGQTYGTSLEPKDKDYSLKSKKKRKLDDDEVRYINSMDTITETKKIEAETKQKQLNLERDKFLYEKEKEENERLFRRE
ncbi:6017_t:CDS:2, partial [Scutellospora calospora]